MLMKSLIRSALICFLFCFYFTASVFADDIHIAVERGSAEEVKAALKANPEAVNSKLPNGTQPLHIAAEMGNVEIVDLLISAGADVHAEAYYSRKPLSFAMRGKHYEVVKRLVKAGAVDNNDELQNALGWSVCFDVEMAKIFIASGADVDGRSFLGRTPLHHAASSKRPDTVELLIKMGANVDSIDKKDFTPLLLLGTRMQGDKDAGALVEIARMLLHAGANPEFTDEDDWTILHYAAWFNVADLVKALVDEGLDINAEDKHGNTPLDLARRQRFQRIITILEVAESS